MSEIEVWIKRLKGENGTWRSQMHVKKSPVCKPPNKVGFDQVAGVLTTQLRKDIMSWQEECKMDLELSGYMIFFVRGYCAFTISLSRLHVVDAYPCS